MDHRAIDVGGNPMQRMGTPQDDKEGTNNNEKTSGDEGKPSPEQLRLLGSTPEMAVYVGVKKLTVVPGTTDRVVLSPQLRRNYKDPEVFGLDTQTRGAAFTFRRRDHLGTWKKLSLGRRAQLDDEGAADEHPGPRSVLTPQVDRASSLRS